MSTPPSGPRPSPAPSVGARPPQAASAGYAPAGADASVAGNRSWWDANAAEYLAEHGDFLGDASARFVWGPEGLQEDDAHLLGDVAGRRVLEVGAGAAQCTRWLRERGVEALACDLSAGMLRGAGGAGTVLQCDARSLPLADACVDVVFSAYGVLPFVADPELVHREVARVLRPGGRWVFSVTHPLRWAFPDDPGPAGLTATRSYFDRTPYAEFAADGRVLYAEHHRTLGDRVREVTAAGFRLLDVVEPEWPQGHERVWGGWSPLRGRLLPGTAVFVCERDGSAGA
ncbi:MAG: class I SAM-dependent methyltransferase [Kineosporiaceae bacterium]